MKEITGTIYAAEIQTAAHHGIEYVPRENTTLNEHFSVIPLTPLADGEYPICAYWCAGMGGHRLTASAGGKPKISPIKHRASDAALYEHVPLVLRLESDDLSPTERESYYLRYKKVIRGKNYFAYEAKALDLSKTTTELWQVTVTDGVTTTIPFVPSSDNNNPTPPIITPDQVVPALQDGNYLLVQAITDILVSEKDIQEYRNAVEIIYQDAELAVMSEIGLFMGVPRSIQAEGAGGSTFAFTEVAVATMAQIASTYENLNFANAEFTMILKSTTTKSLLTES